MPAKRPAKPKAKPANKAGSAKKAAPKKPRIAKPAPSEPAVPLSLLEQAQQMHPLEFFERYLRVEDKQARLVPFKANRVQELLTEIAMAQEEAGFGVRIIDDKSRQQGSSTWGQAWQFRKAVLLEGQRCLTIASKGDYAAELHEKQLTFYKYWPKEAIALLPERDQRARGKKLRLENRSLLFTESAEDRDAGRSMTFQHGHLTEFPLWPNAEGTYSAMDPCIPPNAPNTTIFIESTARGRSNFFYEMWEQAMNKLNEFSPIFTPWYWSREYSRDLRKGEPALGKNLKIDALYEMYTVYANEAEAYNAHRKDGLTKAQAYYYRDKLVKQKDKIGREYPWTAEESFSATEEGFFYADALDWILNETVIEPLYRGIFKEDGSFERSPDGPWWLFEEPHRLHYYTLAIDPASGRGRDTSAMTLMNASTGCEVASFQSGSLTPDQVADQAVRAGRHYRGADPAALCIPERNSGPGALVLNRLINTHHYPYIYIHERADAINIQMATTYGWLTTEKSRGAMLEALASRIHNREWKIRCARTAEEMQKFVYNSNGRPEAGHRATDDLVITKALCAVARPWVPAPIDPSGSSEVKRVYKVSEIVGW